MEQQRRDLVEFAAKFRVQDFYLTETQGWVLSLRPGQTVLGAMVLSIQSGCRDLAALTPGESMGMGAGFGIAERLARETFGAVRVNILCLMMQDPIVHFHILPRYDSPLDFAGSRWTDTDWPGPPPISPSPTDETSLQSILVALRDTL